MQQKSLASNLALAWSITLPAISAAAGPTDLSTSNLFPHPAPAASVIHANKQLLEAERVHIDEANNFQLFDTTGALAISTAIFGGLSLLAYSHYRSRRPTEQELSPLHDGSNVVAPHYVIEDIGGSEDCRRFLTETSEAWREAMAGSGFGDYPSKILLEAPTGSGKSSAAEALAWAAGFKQFVRLDAGYIIAPPSHLTPIGVLHCAVAKAEALAKELPIQKPEIKKGFGMLVVEGAENFAFQAAYNTQNSEYFGVRQVLARLAASYPNLFIVVTTNNQRVLHNDFVESFDQVKKIYSPESLAQRMDLIERTLGRLQREWGDKFPEFPKDILGEFARVMADTSPTKVAKILSAAAKAAYNDQSRAEKIEVKFDQLFNALLESTCGRARYDLTFDPELLKKMKLHEASHFITYRALGIPIRFVTMVPRGDDAARVFGDLRSRLDWPSSGGELLEAAFALGAGRAGELARYGPDGVSRGASHDLQIIFKIGAVLAEHGFLGLPPIPNASSSNPLYHPELRAIQGKFAERVFNVVSKSIKATFTEAQIDAMLEKIPDISATTPYLVGRQLDKLIDKLMSPDDLAKLRGLLLEEVKNFSLAEPSPAMISPQSEVRSLT